MDALLILAIGIATVLGLILVFRVNAFLALLTAAIVVSLLAPGEIADKISRVARELGNSAGNIAVVIALAAIIGECMMLSGAADRIVQAFLRMLGEKRTSWALMSSGYILAVPVFFDTVFYLLVPLARSLYRKTKKNYLLSILAIAAGGAITHTLVPPTPGPLLMASNLNIDVGLMILIGGLVAIPAAIAGLAVSRYLDAKLDIPYREAENTPPEQPSEAVSLPPLWLSLLPVLLPVLLISAKTALSTIADNEGVARLTVADVSHWDELQTTLQSTDPILSPAGRVRSLLTDDLRQSIDAATPLSAESQSALIEHLNGLMSTADVGQFLLKENVDPAIAKAERGRLLYLEAPFESVVLPNWKIQQLLKSTDHPQMSDAERAALEQGKNLNKLLGADRSKLNRNDRERMHRTLLEVAFPGQFQQHVYRTEKRQWAEYSSLIGDPNFALLLSTIAAMFLLFRQKKPTLSEMSRLVEQALMSAGVIILITAAGGAFGAMLKAAQVGERIQSLFDTGTGETAAVGLTFLMIGYGVAALLKVAQGSSTTAMIVGSSMLAAMIGSGTTLGFNPVYLATAIGAGSLLGSWMNDSGFWIFAKMGGLTEGEALKSWTVMLAVLSVVSLTISVLLALVMPLNGV